MTDPFNPMHTQSRPDTDLPIDPAPRCCRIRPPPPATPPPTPPAVPKGPSFAELGLHADVLRAVDEMGFSEPMPVQATTFPLITAGRDLMVQSRTGSGKTAAFGIPFANGIVNAEDKFVQAIILLPTRELALQVAAELAQICAHRADHGGAGLRRRADGPADRAAARRAARSSAARRAACSTTCGAARCGSTGCAAPCSTSATRCCRWASRRTSRRSSRRTPTERQTLLFSATVPEGIQRLARRFLRNPEFLKLSGDYVGVHEIRHVYYSIPGGPARERAAAHPRLRGPEVGDHLLQHARGDRPRGRVPAPAGLRRRGDLVGPVAERSRARDGPDARGRHPVPGRDRRRGARHRHREPVARHQLHLPRVARDLHPPHRPHRPRRPAGDGDLADRPDRGRVVLLPEAALQDQARGARAAVGGGDPLAPRGRAAAGAAARAARAIRAASGARWRGG